jgi:GNAT superfamily N-acetyltransferase
MNDIRPAKPQDADEACEIVRRSISELCHEDHGGDPMELQGWLANKTPANFRTWFTQLGLYGFIAEREGAMAGVGLLAGSGEIMLLYVSPEARFHGVSKALLTAMEEQLLKLRKEICSLTTTQTAKRFYLDRGYQLLEDEESIDDGFGLDASVSMTKRLVP